jgi:hypothetical protein
MNINEKAGRKCVIIKRMLHPQTSDRDKRTKESMPQGNKTPDKQNQTKAENPRINRLFR